MSSIYQSFKRLKCLQKPNFFLLCFGIFISKLCSSAYSFAVSFYLLETTGSTLALGGYISISYLVSTFIGPWIGKKCDQYQRVKVVYITDFLRAILLLMTAIFVLSNAPKLYIVIYFFTMSVLENIINLFFDNASFGLVREIAEESELNDLNVSISLANSIGSLIGVALAGVGYLIVPFIGFVLMNAVSFFLSAVSEMFIHVEKRAILPKQHHEPSKISIKDAFNKMAHSQMRFFYILSILFNCMYNALNSLILVTAIEAINQYASLSLYQGVVMVASILLSMFVNIDKENLLSVFKRSVAGYCCISIASFLIYLIDEPFFLSAFMVGLAIMSSWFVLNISLSVKLLLQLTGNIHNLSSSLALFNAVTHSITPIFMILISSLMDIHVRYVLIVYAVLTILGIYLVIHEKESTQLKQRLNSQ